MYDLEHKTFFMSKDVIFVEINFPFQTYATDVLQNSVIMPSNFMDAELDMIFDSPIVENRSEVVAVTPNVPKIDISHQVVHLRYTPHYLFLETHHNRYKEG